ncbi:MAG: hypothetical protein ACPGYR_06075 [Chitinophagales bacterium]
MNNEFKDQVIGALVHFLYTFFVYFLFIVPFDLWKKATVRLSEQKDRGAVNISNITGLWPFLSFLKAFILEFLLDGFIFITYFLGPVAAVIIGISTEEFWAFFATLVWSYYYPVFLSLIRDFIQIAILPFRKYLDWARKPAQHLDLEIKNK